MRNTSCVRRRTRLGLLLSLAVLALMPAAAHADHHEMKIQEIFPGSTANAGQDYVTLQMYASGQNFVDGHSLTVYNAAGTAIHTATFPASPSPGVPHGANQSTILIGAASSVVGVTPDLVDAGMTAIDPAGGAVCWNATPISFVDCASWGNFTGDALLPSSAGTPADSPGGIGDGTVLTREITRGCSTLLEASDDTNDSGNDYAGGGPVPRNNATTPTEQACPNTQITKGPAKTTHDRTPTFKFKSVPAGAPSFECAVDHRGSFSGCTSPITLPKLGFGKHKFFVEAQNSSFGADPTPASQTFKVVKRH